MGRREDLPDNMKVARKFHLRNILTGDDGAYDEEGAYWGIADPVYWAHSSELEKVGRRRSGSNQYTYTRSESEWMEINLFIRAKDRNDAKCILLERMPNATFYR